jgi:glutaredoxin-like protein
MALISEDDKEIIKKLFSEKLEGSVRIKAILDEKNAQEQSKILKDLLNELSRIDNRIFVKFIDISEVGNLDAPEGLDNKKGPIILFEDKPNLIYYGIPAGYEFTTLLDDIIFVSTNKYDVPLNFAKKVAKTKASQVLVFFTPMCPFCPKMSSVVRKASYVNPNLKSFIINALEFPELSERYNVRAVPKTIIIKDSEKNEIEGAVPIETFVEYL